MDTAVGWAIMDSGAAGSVCGEAVWNQISDYLLMRGLVDKIDTQGDRDFRFGDGVVVRSKVSVRIPVCIAKTVEGANFACSTWRDPTTSRTT